MVEAAGELQAYEAKWTELPSASDAANLAHLRTVLDKRPLASGGIVCRAANSYPLADGFRALTVGELGATSTEH